MNKDDTLDDLIISLSEKFAFDMKQAAKVIAETTIKANQYLTKNKKW